MMKRLDYEEAVRAFLHRQPFQPFVIEYEDGRRFVVEQPGQLAGAELFIRPDGELDLLDNEEVSRVVELDKAATA